MTQQRSFAGGVTRRGFLGAAAAAALPWPRLLEAGGGFSVKLGYHAITWGDESEQAIDDIAAVGFRGIQLRAKDLTKLGGDLEALKPRLEAKRLELLCFSSGNIAEAIAGKYDEQMELHVKHARAVKALGGRQMQVTATRPKDRALVPDDFKRLGEFMNDLGQRTGDVGVRIAYHNHMDDFGEAPDDVARVLDHTQCRHVDFLLDIAHYAQGGGDAAQGVMRHRDRLTIMHLKDVRNVEPVLDPKTGKMGKNYQFVELGRGRVDVPAVLAALKKVEFRGPAIVELDSVPDKDKGRTAKECAEVNKKYVVETLGLTL